MQTHTITGGDGIQLHVVEAGNADGKAILFIHGYSQCHLAWGKQIESELAEEFRLVAMDIRGHGLSEKPRDAYGDSQLWADDVNAVITTLGLEQPVLAGWSYGGRLSATTCIIMAKKASAASIWWVPPPNLVRQ